MIGQQSNNGTNGDLFITQSDNVPFNSKKFYKNIKQSKTLFNLQDCLPDFNSIQVKKKKPRLKEFQSKNTTLIEFVKNQSRQSHLKYNHSQDNLKTIQSENMNMNAIKNDQKLAKNPQLAHNILRQDRKLNQKYLNFPQLKVDNQQMLDQDSGERKLKLDSIRIRNNSDYNNNNINNYNSTNSNFSIRNTQSLLQSEQSNNQQKFQIDNLKSVKNNTKYSSQFEFNNNNSTDRSFHQQSTKRYIQGKKESRESMYYSTADQLFKGSQQDNSSYYNIQDTLQATDYMQQSQPYSMTNKSLQEIQELHQRYSINQQSQQDHIKESQQLSVDQNNQMQYSTNQYREFNDNNINILNNYLAYLDKNFNEPYFRARMKGKQGEYFNQKLQLLMNEIKLANANEKTKFYKNKFKKNIKKLNALRNLQEKPDQVEKTRKIQQTIKREFDSNQEHTQHQDSQQQCSSSPKHKLSSQQSQQINPQNSLLQSPVKPQSIKKSLQKEYSIKGKPKGSNGQNLSTQQTEQSDQKLSQIQLNQIQAQNQIEQQQQHIQSLQSQQQNLIKKKEQKLSQHLVQDLCDNMNKLIKLKGNLHHAGNKLKTINGFNDKIKGILFEQNGQLKEQFTEQEIKQKILSENDQKLNKKLLYFNKSLEDYLLAKLEDIESDIKNDLTKETQIINQKCFQLLFKDLPKKQQKELIEIKFGRDPKPNYINYTKIANQLDRAETKLQMKFEQVTNMNRNDCQHIDRIMQVYQYI